MLYSEILAKFLEMFPNYQEKICTFGVAGVNTINIFTHDMEVLEFTYQDDREWSLIAQKGNVWAI